MMKQIKECDGNNGNGCFLDSCGHDCGCFVKFEEEAMLKEAAEKMYREFPNNPNDKPEWHYNRDTHCFKKRKAFIAGAKSDAAKEYWFNIFKQLKK